MKGLGDLANLVKQAQEMQKRLAELQNELEREEITAAAGGGMISVTMNGKQKVIRIKIDPEVVNPSDVAMLEDLILVAINEAQDRVQELVKGRMGAMTGGISLPGLGL
jgi:nucleoid-associated protein EbfC